MTPMGAWRRRSPGSSRTGGRYRVTATVAVEPGARLAVGRDLAGDMTSTMRWAVAFALGGLLAAGAIAAAAWRRRSGRTT